MDAPSPRRVDLARALARWLVLIVGLVFGGTFFLAGAQTMVADGRLYAIALAHLPATIGLPSAALAALCLVMFLESTSGAIEFSVLGFSFKGASGPIILWVVCFMAISVAIKLLWSLPV